MAQAAEGRGAAASERAQECQSNGRTVIQLEGLPYVAFIRTAAPRPFLGDRDLMMLRILDRTDLLLVYVGDRDGAGGGNAGAQAIGRAQEQALSGGREIVQWKELMCL